MRRFRPVITASLAIAAIALTGCSPSNPEANEAAGISAARAADPHEPIGPGGAISITAFDLGFQDLTGVAVDGPVTVTLTNVGEAEHNFRIDEAAGDGEPKVTALGGETTEGDLLLFGAPGGAVYTYYCDIPGHKSAGMEGQIIVYLDEAEAATGPLVPAEG